MEFEQLLKLIDHVSDSKLTSFQYETEDTRISMKCRTTNTVMQTPEVIEYKFPVNEKVSEETKEGNVITAPLVGVFYAAPAEDAEPFVKKGDKVTKGQVVAIVEAMKLMNEIESGFDGEIVEIYVENGEAVEYGQPLFRVK